MENADRNTRLAIYPKDVALITGKASEVAAGWSQKSEEILAKTPTKSSQSANFATTWA